MFESKGDYLILVRLDDTEVPGVLWVSGHDPVTGAVSVASHAVLYGGEMRDLSKAWTDGRSEATAINDSGQATGYVMLATRQWNTDRRAFRYADGKTTLIAMPSDWHYSVGTAINSAGDVVGYFERAGVRHAFWSHGGRIDDLNVLVAAQSGWTLAEGTGVNDRGQIIGIASYRGAPHGFLYVNGHVTGLGSLRGLSRSEGLSINNHGEVVGAAYPDGLSLHALEPSHAFLSRGGKMVDLNSLIRAESGWFLYDGQHPLVIDRPAVSVKDLF